MKNQGKGTISVFCAIILIMLTCCTGLAGAEEAPTFKYPYGVFLSICENIEQFADYEIVVIDAQYYPKEELDAFRSKGHKVFSYINIGSLEDFRDYYDEYKDLSLGAYEHWAGTSESMSDASNFIGTIVNMQGVQVAALEEISFRKGWINAEQLLALAEPMKFDASDIDSLVPVSSQAKPRPSV